ncbi:MAG: hypothetical protein WD267_01090 [Balneolales bacterium]
MSRAIPRKTLAREGYIFAIYGKIKYLKHAVASASTIRRYDDDRPIALVCEQKHHDELKKNNMLDMFDFIYPLGEQHDSIVGFKHNIHEYMLFDRNLYLDCDMVWCKDPNPLWTSLSSHPFTITGNQTADHFFGGPKNFSIITDFVLARRQRTLDTFGLTYLSRVQSGMMYAQDYELTKKVCLTAAEMLERKDETHFLSRTLEEGRTEESCEWSLAMAMSKLNIPVHPWLQGHTSPQLDYISDLTNHDRDFEYVSCKYYSNNFIYSFRGLKSKALRNILLKTFSIVPGFGDHLAVVPYALHFGWYHQKRPFYSFSNRTWNYNLEKSAAERLEKNKAGSEDSVYSDATV